MLKKHIEMLRETYELDLKDLKRNKQPSGFHLQKIRLVEGFITELNEIIIKIDNVEN